MLNKVQDSTALFHNNFKVHPKQTSETSDPNDHTREFFKNLEQKSQILYLENTTEFDNYLLSI